MSHSSCVLPLPTSLVLLLHLHILSYPQCNSPEYTPETLFSPSRPLRDRTKTMEDISAFLIEKIEGKAKCKSILGGTYPCLQPSDTVAFRVNVAKYLETLRATVTRQGLQVSTSKGRITGGKNLQAESVSSNAKSSTSSQKSFPNSSTRSSVLETSPIAWWWSAIVVRKSLLEESSGDRFEKLLLALSTHALFVQVPPSSSLHPLNTTKDLTNELRLQPQEYAELLSRSLGLHAKHAQSISRLNIQTEELRSWRTRLALTPRDNTERVDPTRLIAIRDSKLQDLVDAWQTILHTSMSSESEGQFVSTSDALKWILSIAGISTDDSQPEAPLSFAGTFSPDIGISLQGSDFVVAQTLPTASAHHPANRHKLRSLPSFVSLYPDSTINETSDARSTVSSPALQELLRVASAEKAALEAALDSAVTAGRAIAQRLDIILKTAAAAQEREGLRELDMWTPPVKNTVLDVKVSPMHDPSVMRLSSKTSSTSSLADETHTLQRIEASVLSVKNSLLPSIPSPSTLDAGNSNSLESLQHGLPAAITKQQSSKIPLPTAAFISGSSRSVTSVTETSHLKSIIPISRPNDTSTPAPKTHSKTVRAMGVAESKSSDANDAQLTPTDSRGFTTTKTNIMKTSPPQDMIAEMPLIGFTDVDLIGLGRASSQKFTCDEERQQEHVTELEQADIPYEGHSVTLRDILLRAGDGEDSFHLIGDLEDLDEHLGNETIGWG